MEDEDLDVDEESTGNGVDEEEDCFPEQRSVKLKPPWDKIFPNAFAQDRYRKEVKEWFAGFINDPELCTICCAFILDVVSQDVWYQGGIFSEDSSWRFNADGGEVCFRRPAPRGQMCSSFETIKDCALCRLLSHAWRLKEPDESRWPADMDLILTADEPTKYFQVDTGDNDQKHQQWFTRFEVCADSEGGKWLDEWFVGKDVLEEEEEAYREMQRQEDELLAPFPNPANRNRDGHVCGPAYTGSEEVAREIEAFLRECPTNHEAGCQRLEVGLPSRVIDVGTDSRPPKLYVSNAEMEPYLTLSYCWGRASSQVLTKETLEAFQKRIPLRAMPLTIKHAIQLTRMLGYQYLWIDALCILQGDQEDWLRESAHMADIFGGSQLTIVAAHSTSRHSGLFFDRHVQVTKQPVPGGSHVFVRRCVWEIEKFEWAEGRLTDSRAWTLQELILSKALVHFATDKVNWQCMALMENHHIHPSEFFVRAKEAEMTKLMLEFAEMNLKGTEKYSMAKYPSTRQLFYSLAREYSDRRLTKETDRLAALAGMARYYEFLEPDCGEYLAGIFQGDLPGALLWCNRSWTDESLRDMRTDIPSWSWAISHLPCRVEWPDEFQGRVDPTQTAFDAIIDPIRQPYISDKRKAVVGLEGHIYLLAHVSELTEPIVLAITAPDARPKPMVLPHPAPTVTSIDDFRHSCISIANKKAYKKAELLPGCHWQAVIDRPWSVLQTPLYLARICSWEMRRHWLNEEQWRLSEGYIDTYFLLLEAVPAQPVLQSSSTDELVGVLDEKLSISHAADPKSAGTESAMDSTMYFRRAGILAWNHSRFDESVMNNFERQTIALV